MIVPILGPCGPQRVLRKQPFTNVLEYARVYGQYNILTVTLAVLKYEPVAVAPVASFL